MKKWLIILIVVVLIIIIAILLSNLPFDVTPNNNVSYEELIKIINEVYGR